MTFGLGLVFLGGFLGFLMGLTGSGGSLVSIPFLIYGLGISFGDAAFLSICSVFALASAGVVKNLWKDQIQWRLVPIFVMGSLVTPFATEFAQKVPDKVRMIALSCVMLLSAWEMVRKKDGIRSFVHPQWVVGILLVVGALILGFVSGFFGIGGGIIVVPILTIVLGLSYKKSVATSLSIIAIVSGITLASNIMNGNRASFSVVLLMLFSGFVGLSLGFRVLDHVPERLCKRYFAIFIVIFAVFMLFDQFFLHQ